MRKLVIAILPLLVLGCAVHDAGSALEVTAASKSTRAQLGRTVDAIVRSFAREHGFRLEHESSSRSRFQTYAVEPPDQPAATSLYVFYEPDGARIEISEIGVSRPSRKHLDIRRAIKTRLESAGLTVSRTEPTIIPTF